MSVIEIPIAERGVIRVFAISRPMSEMARLLKQHSKPALASTLLSHPVSQDDIELFALSDLAGVGLPAYLTDGYDVDKAAVRADRARLDALDGYVLLLFSRVSNDGDVTLHPSSDLTLIGTYAEPKSERSAVPIATASAKLYSGVTPTPRAPERSRVGSALTAVVALLILTVIWWILR
ncbi:hypothetical protein OS189_11210 [Sulfitobacter sp. F26169L]|uniref:hypothetical protein n=1 Tax=Sulfitobacter sp. F26169L TaxID=2996015 RepID=UPI00226096A5|nr:hypothetical protein [Sulfitobacter sp. F26169L]MCX7566908.1 hypothetical protein [Sulfitobacter sp. F26169L]